jgi:hypothetical protein
MVSRPETEIFSELEQLCATSGYTHRMHRWQRAMQHLSPSLMYTSRTVKVGARVPFPLSYPCSRFPGTLANAPVAVIPKSRFGGLVLHRSGKGGSP